MIDASKFPVGTKLNFNGKIDWIGDYKIKVVIMGPDNKAVGTLFLTPAQVEAAVQPAMAEQNVPSIHLLKPNTVPVANTVEFVAPFPDLTHAVINNGAIATKPVLSIADKWAEMEREFS